MVSEEIPIDFNFQSLKEEFLSVQNNFSPVMITPKFGGWSVTSSTGSYQDGWVAGEEFEEDQAGPNFDMDRILKKKQFKGINEYRKPTECCGSEARSLIAKIENLGLFPCRVRYMLMKAGGGTNYHRDCPDDVYAVRLHIPIITNENCFFKTESESQHLLAGHSYLLKVNRLHQAVNQGQQDRVHLICDVYDMKGISQFHKVTQKDIEYFKSRKKFL